MSKRGENIYKRKDGRWEARIRKPDGHYAYVYGKTYREVKNKKANYVFHKKSPIMNTAEKSGVQAFQDWLINDVKSRVKQSTYDSYFSCIHKYIIPFFQSGSNQINETEIADCTQSILANQQISVAYKKKILTIFKTALSDILEHEKLDTSTLKVVKFPKVESGNLEVFSIHEQYLIEQTLYEDNDRRTLAILVCFYSGIRLGELCALRWGNIDIEAKTMTIEGTVNRVKNTTQMEDRKTELILSAPKSRNSIRKIPIPDFLADMFRDQEYRNRAKGNFLLTGSERLPDPRGVQRMYKRLLVNAGVQDRKFHTIRHTFVTRALESGVDVNTISEILGHSNVSTTLNIYAHSMLEHKRIAIEKMSAARNVPIKIIPCAVKNSVKPA